MGDAGGFATTSAAPPLGRYFGSAEDPPGFVLGRRVADLGIPTLGGGVVDSVEDLGGCSSGEERSLVTRLRVIVFESGVPARNDDGGLTSPIEGRGAAGADEGFWTLRRRELVSFDFLGTFSASLPSLFITSAKAFPTDARLRVLRKELLVDGLAGVVPLMVEKVKGCRVCIQDMGGC